MPIKKIHWVLLSITIAILAYFCWIFLRPVKVIAVHEDENFSDVLVTHFPLTDRGKIRWWQDNREMLKIRYGIPKPAPYGSYTITFWLFRDGYMEEGKYDRLCFNDMKNNKNCIEKNKVFSVTQGSNGGISFLVYDGIYTKNKNGDWIKKPF